MVKYSIIKMIIIDIRTEKYLVKVSVSIFKRTTRIHRGTTRNHRETTKKHRETTQKIIEQQEESKICNYCKKKFSRADSLNRHTKIMQR